MSTRLFYVLILREGPIILRKHLTFKDSSDFIFITDYKPTTKLIVNNRL